MGGGKSSSKSYTYNTIKFDPTINSNTEVNVDLEELTKAINNSSKNQIAGLNKQLNQQLQVSKLEMALQKAGLDLEKQKQAQEWLKDQKTRNQLTILVLLIGGSYIYKKMGKGKKK